MNYVKKCFNHYADFDGRARRSEYWLWILFVLVIYGVLYFISAMIASAGSSSYGSSSASAAVMIIPNIWGLIVLIPTIAVGVRRLHDTGRGGGWFFINFVPFIGGIWFFVLMVIPGEHGRNRFGENPKVKEARTILDDVHEV